MPLQLPPCLPESPAIARVNLLNNVTGCDLRCSHGQRGRSRAQTSRCSHLVIPVIFFDTTETNNHSYIGIAALIRRTDANARKNAHYHWWQTGRTVFEHWPDRDWEACRLLVQMTEKPQTGASRRVSARPLFRFRDVRRSFAIDQAAARYLPECPSRMLAARLLGRSTWRSSDLLPCERDEGSIMMGYVAAK
jgi:hypothetical protein